MPIDPSSIIQDQALQSGVDPNLALAIILQGERSGPTAVSPKGAIGESQLMPATAQSLGVNPWDREQNLRGGVRYMRQLQDDLGTTDPRLIAAGYNAGPGAVHKAGGVPNYPETQAYVQRVSDAIPSKQFDDSDFDSKSGATRGQNSSGIAPQFADSDFQTAAPVQSVSGSAPSAPGLLDQAKRAGALGLRSGLEGVTKLLGIVGDPLNAASDKFLGTHFGSASDVGNQLANRMDLPTPATGMERFSDAATQGLLGTMLTGGAGTAIKGASAAGGLADAIGTSLSSNLGAQAAGAVGGAAGVSGAENVGKALDLSPGAQTALNLGSGVAGGILGGGVGGKFTNGIAPEVQATLDAAKPAKVPVHLSDVNPSWRAAMRLAGKLPFSLGTVLGGNKAPEQVAGVRAALANAAEAYRPPGLDVTSGAQGTDRFLANDLRTVASQRQTQNDALYKAVDNIAGNSALPAAALPQTSATAQQLWERFPDALKGLELDSKTSRILNSLKPGAEEAAQAPQTFNVMGKQMTWDEMSPSMQSQLRAAGISPTAAEEAPPLTFQNLNDLRTGLGDALGQAKQAALSGGQSRQKLGILSQMYGAVTDDIDGYLNSPGVPPELKTAAQSAQDYFKNNILPMRNDARINQVLASTPNGEGVDEAAQGLHNYLFSANKGETAQKYLGLLSPAGQQAAAYQAIKGATDSALNTATEAGIKSAAGIGKLEGSPALDAVANANPGMSADMARVQALMRLGRTAATSEAGKGVLTGFQGRDVGSFLAIREAADQLEQHGMGAGAAYATAAGVPLGLANSVALLNSRSPDWLRNYLLRQAGPTAPRAIQGALATQYGGQ